MRWRYTNAGSYVLWCNVSREISLLRNPSFCSYSYSIITVPANRYGSYLIVMLGVIKLLSLVLRESYSPRSQVHQNLFSGGQNIYNRAVLVCTVNVHMPASLGRRPIFRYQVQNQSSDCKQSEYNCLNYRYETMCNHTLYCSIFFLR